MRPGIPVLPLPGRKPLVAVRPDACRVRATRAERAVAADQEPPPDPRADLADPDREPIDLGDGLIGHGPGQRTRSRPRSSAPGLSWSPILLALGRRPMARPGAERSVQAVLSAVGSPDALDLPKGCRGSVTVES